MTTSLQERLQLAKNLNNSNCVLSQEVESTKTIDQVFTVRK